MCTRIKYCLIATAMLFMQGAVYAQVHDLRIVTYNIFKGMELDSTDGKQLFVQWVKKQNPDVLALQEANMTLPELKSLASRYGHDHVVLLKEGGYPCALTSKLPLSGVKRVLEDVHRGYIKAEVGGYHIVVLHHSPAKFQERHEDMEKILRSIESANNQERWIIVGDFNAHSASDSIYYADGLLHESIRQRDSIYSFHANLVHGNLDFSVIDQLSSAGFIDALRLKKPEGFQVTFPTQRFQDDRPASRIDFVFVSEGCVDKVKDVRVIRDDFTHNFSDHYPLFISFSEN